MFLGVMSIGSAIFLLCLILYRVSASVYNRDISPYLRKGEKPPILDFNVSPRYEDVKNLESHVSHVNRKKEEWKNNIITQHQQFLRTPLGQSYLRILKAVQK